jgi:hypothetical protein
MDEPIPDLVLADTLWDFANQEDYSSRKEFIDAVRRYHVQVQEYAPDINPAECWQPSAMVLSVQRVIVRFVSEPLNGPEEDCEVELLSDDGQAFTASELLYKLHNRAIGRLRDNHHRWFEGLELCAITEEGVPVYTLRLGS